MAYGACRHGVSLLMVCPMCDGQQITVDDMRRSTVIAQQEALREMEQRIRTAQVLEFRWHLATHQIMSGPNAGMWESGQIEKRDGDTVWLIQATTAIALQPWEAVEQAAARAATYREQQVNAAEGIGEAEEVSVHDA